MVLHLNLKTEFRKNTDNFTTYFRQKNESEFEKTSKKPEVFGQRLIETEKTETGIVSKNTKLFWGRIWSYLGS